MTANDPLTLLRLVLGDTNQSGRWTNGTLLSFIDRGNKRVVRDVKFPDSRLTTTTVANVGEYQLPPIILPLRVYVAGQLAVPTDINTLEGHQVGLYDQTTGGTGALPANTSAPPGTTGPYAPQWVDQTPLSYPVGNSWVTPAPDSQPWYNGQRPRYYLRGGYIGLVPAPANAVTLTVDCVREPDTITATAQAMTTPDVFQDAIVWAAAAYCAYADSSSVGAAQRQIAEENYQRFMRDARAWRKMYDQGDSPGGPKPLTYRARYVNSRPIKRSCL